MKEKQKDLWPKIGEQAERNAMLYNILDELEIYEALLEQLYFEQSARPMKLEDIKSERDLKTEIEARQSMIRVLALKNTTIVV